MKEAIGCHRWLTAAGGSRPATGATAVGPAGCFKLGTAVLVADLAVGGGLIAAIALASIWKSTTGRGWTWRGRSLA